MKGFPLHCDLRKHPQKNSQLEMSRDFVTSIIKIFARNLVVFFQNEFVPSFK